MSNSNSKTRKRQQYYNILNMKNIYPATTGTTVQMLKNVLLIISCATYKEQHDLRKSGKNSNVLKHCDIIRLACKRSFFFFAFTEDVEVDVESIVFDCVDSEGLSITHTDADHCYSSMDKSWLWSQRSWRQHGQTRGGTKHSKRADWGRTVTLLYNRTLITLWFCLFVCLFFLFFVNIMSDQKLSDNNELCPLALDGRSGLNIPHADFCLSSGHLPFRTETFSLTF